jgi:hypothetical protein
MTDPTPEAIRAVMAALGRKGGQASGPRKARTRAQARKAVRARWARQRKPRGQKN